MPFDPYAELSSVDLQKLINSMQISRNGARKIKDPKVRREQVGHHNAIIKKAEAELRRRRKNK